MSHAPLLTAHAARTSWCVRVRNAVLAELEAEHGLRYRALAERELVRAEDFGVIEFAFREGLRAAPRNADEIAATFVKLYGPQIDRE